LTFSREFCLTVCRVTNAFAGTGECGCRGKGQGIFFSEGQLVLPFRQGESSRFTPQNKFCGYENPAFQAKILSNTEISIAVEVFNSPANLCLKGNNLYNRRYASCGQRQQENSCLKGRTIAVVRMNIYTGKKNKQNENL